MEYTADERVAAIAAAIADPARTRMLCSLLDGCARTATELAAVAGISAPTASSHFQRLMAQGLVALQTQGRHRYYRLAGGDIARALEALLVVADAPRPVFEPSTPTALRHARTCYDHMAGTVAVTLHDALVQHGWLEDYRLTPLGTARLAALGLDASALQKKKRRLACACMDWSARRPHLGGALGAALLDLSLARGWVTRGLDSRALRLSGNGARQMSAAFGVLFEREPRGALPAAA